MSVLWITRHAVTSRPGYYWGQTDIPLATDGVRQAEELSDGTRDCKIVEVVSSPQRRAYDTAKIVADRFGYALRTDARLAARDYGDYTQQPKAKIAEVRAPYYKTRADRWTWRPPRGETNIDVLGRTCDFLTSEPLNHRLLVLHEDSMRILIGALEGDYECLFKRYTNCRLERRMLDGLDMSNLMSIVDPDRAKI